MPESKKRTPKKSAAKTSATGTAKEVAEAKLRASRPTAVSSADEWLVEAEGVLTELPSGKVVRTVMPGMQAFIEADLIPNELMPIILGAINQHQPAVTNDLQEMQRDPAMLLKLVETTDRIFAYCVTEPKFELAVAREERESGVLYTDMVTTEDKTYVFQLAVGGTRDLARFRQEQATELAALQVG